MSAKASTSAATSADSKAETRVASGSASLLQGTVLHKLVFKNDIDGLKSELERKVHDVNARDSHGNTPLLLSAILGRAEV